MAINLMALSSADEPDVTSMNIKPVYIRPGDSFICVCSPASRCLEVTLSRNFDMDVKSPIRIAEEEKTDIVTKILPEEKYYVLPVYDIMTERPTFLMQPESAKNVGIKGAPKPALFAYADNIEDEDKYYTGTYEHVDNGKKYSNLYTFAPNSTLEEKSPERVAVAKEVLEKLNTLPEEELIEMLFPSHSIQALMVDFPLFKKKMDMMEILGGEL